MTSGTVGDRTNLILRTGQYEYKGWSGEDGKYEIHKGMKRVKWNSYSMEYETRYRQERDAHFWRAAPWDIPPYMDSTAIPLPGPNPNLLGWPSFLNFSNNDKLAVMAKLLERVKSHDFNLAVNAAQGRELVDMVALNLRKLARAAIALRRGRFDVAARQWGATAKKNTSLKTTDISGRWLELQYGWLPSLSDTFEAAKAFEAISNGPRKTTFSARKPRSTRGGFNTNGLVDTWWDCSADYRIKFELEEEMSAERQLGLTDPLSVAWEIVPYSFVVDWFIPIGTYLSVLNQIPKLKGRFLVTQRREVKGPILKWSDPKPAYLIGISLPKDEGYYKEVVRTPSESLEPPLPNFVDGLSGSPKRIANAISLAHQAFAPALSRGLFGKGRG